MRWGKREWKIPVHVWVRTYIMCIYNCIFANLRDSFEKRTKSALHHIFLFSQLPTSVSRGATGLMLRRRVKGGEPLNGSIDLKSDKRDISSAGRALLVLAVLSFLKEIGKEKSFFWNRFSCSVPFFQIFAFSFAPEIQKKSASCLWLYWPP